MSEDAATETRSRKPRIALMGEFSAGKSTLSNLLIGAQTSPVKVTATQLPPIWFSQGDDPPYLENVDGDQNPVDLDRLDDVDTETTRYIRIFLRSDVLALCDLIDMPGISDPNMSSAVWERAIDLADGVVWCTHATQAWRQSEAAVWEAMPPDLHHHSILLLTRIDKILDPRDRGRVLARVRKETQGMFRTVLPIALLDAIAAGEDQARWEASGAAAFTESLTVISRELDRAIRLGGRPQSTGIRLRKTTREVIQARTEFNVESARAAGFVPGRTREFAPVHAGPAQLPAGSPKAAECASDVTVPNGSVGAMAAQPAGSVLPRRVAVPPREGTSRRPQ